MFVNGVISRNNMQYVYLWNNSYIKSVHPKNKHNTSYNFIELVRCNPDLSPFVIENTFGITTVDFSNKDAIFHLNKAILKCDYGVTDWNIPNGYLCSPIPGRADYIHYIYDLIGATKETVRGLDIGVGANCIYPILGTQIYNWDMVGADSNSIAVISAKSNAEATSALMSKIAIRYQANNANIFEGIIGVDEYFHFTMCNPPFHASEIAATKGTLRKLKNLNKQCSSVLNFGGQANELWCNGGEALFIKRMIKQSITFKSQVGWFTSLVSKKENLPKIYKLLEKLKATYKTIEMTQGKKTSRFVAWKFN
ncbi:MAG: 23S rRNA (adenine(1618)-N(6))-methyltransferase RlmF [Cellulophaga sp.]